jgi:hypothetical protein
MRLVRLQTLSLIFLFLFLVPAYVNAQSGSSAQSEEESKATLEETLEWLKAKMLRHGVVFERATLKDDPSGADQVDFTQTISAVKFTTCSFQWESTWEWIANKQGAKVDKGSSISKRTYRMMLGDIDPLSLKHISLTQSGKIYGVTIDNQKTIKYETKRIKPHEAIEEEARDYFEIEVDNDEVAARIKRALQHAIKLCGGKVEPF